MELSDLDKQEIARLITDGYTGGIIDSEGDDESKNKSYRISWDLKFEKFLN